MRGCDESGRAMARDCKDGGRVLARVAVKMAVYWRAWLRIWRLRAGARGCDEGGSAMGMRGCNNNGRARNMRGRGER